MSSATTPSKGSTASADDRHLSAKLQTMKFMRRSADRAKADEEQKQEKKTISESHWRATYADTVIPEERPKKRVVYESSYLKMPRVDDGSSSATNLGRRSFKAFNKQTDLVNAEYEAKVHEQELDQEQKQMEVDDKAMAKALSGDKPKRTKPQQPAGSLREQNEQLKRKHE
ncbi:hypothetical protein LPJ66_007650 [Kickxella alabastrina]|uniref:Uncharacterized protein n=1 Tax=Kickxella alabastrina TaxID=61397 RepID=A0ACC1IAS7_9FUNG|nr:hypothetical protein LPJ66_007650 [Kickxella alabastrina]